jgi:hypothetical protein
MRRCGHAELARVIKVTPLRRQRCSEPGGQGDAALFRTLMLTELHDWCMSRLSKLSLAGENQVARALTADHLELLEAVNHHQTLWMVIEADG